MIDLQQGVITHDGVAHPIKSWAVWWRTPTGLFQQLEAAIMDAEQSEFPITMIRSIPVAIGDGVYEERP
jgi:hypothetical protein